MNNEITRYTTPGLERRQRRSSEVVVAEVHQAAQQADGAMALAAHVMAGLTDLDKLRQQLAGDDIALNMLLSDIEGRAVSQCKQVQSQLFGPWRL